ncbi:tetratricopeptide repeat protein [Stenotrophomonas humi]|uniref:tetratricopeptide repeat protein n=1 Tax=Stenotrophomonas humi TaxID=405444 RepID=UPI00128F3256|nr:hypothetical protein [Stenotrophomonas humi]
MERLRAQYENAPSTQAATELEEAAFILGKELSSDDQEIVSKSARSTLGPSDFDPVRQPGIDRMVAIRMLRARVSFSPNQPLAWTELARHHLASGNQAKASDAMSCAVQLAPNNRYVLRSAARFYSRSEDGLDRALWLLRKSPRTSRDPWLLAAEIASADMAERPSPFVKLAKSMLDTKRSGPRHYSELAAAVGTLEHESGRHKKAKQLMVQALVDPTGNSLAQAVYLSQSDKRIVVPAQFELSQGDFEANARAYYAEGRFELSLSAAFAWLHDEPFDVKPALLGSFLSFDDSLAGGAERIATLGLQSSPHHSSLHNNRAVARAYLGDLPGALDDVKNSNRGGRQEPSHLATLGLLGYRMGLEQFGEECYTKAIAWFSSIGDMLSCYRACLYWSRERGRLGDPNVVSDLAFLKDRISRLPLDQQESDLFALISAVDREMGRTQIQPLWPAPDMAMPSALDTIRASFRLPDAAARKALAFESNVLPLLAD